MAKFIYYSNNEFLMMMGSTTIVDPNADLHDRMDELVSYAEGHPKKIDFLIDPLTSSRLRMNAAKALGKTGDCMRMISYASSVKICI